MWVWGEIMLLMIIGPRLTINWILYFYYFWICLCASWALLIPRSSQASCRSSSASTWTLPSRPPLKIGVSIWSTANTLAVHPTFRCCCHGIKIGVLLAPQGALYLTPPGDPSVQSTYSTTMLHPSEMALFYQATERFNTKESNILNHNTLVLPLFFRFTLKRYSCEIKLAIWSAGYPCRMFRLSMRCFGCWTCLELISAKYGKHV